MITWELQPPVFERGPNQPSLARPPSRPLDPILFTPVHFDCVHSAEWWQVNEQEACARRERQGREAVAHVAEVLENYHGPRW
jgi:hypothetical protein